MKSCGEGEGESLFCLFRFACVRTEVSKRHVFILREIRLVRVISIFSTTAVPFIFFLLKLNSISIGKYAKTGSKSKFEFYSRRSDFKANDERIYFQHGFPYQPNTFSLPRRRYAELIDLQSNTTTKRQV